MGVRREKIDAAFEFDTNPLFGAAERAALHLAHDSALTPNASTDAHFDALRPVLRPARRPDATRSILRALALRGHAHHLRGESRHAPDQLRLGVQAD